MPDSVGHTTTGSIFDDLGRSPDQAVNLKVRAYLLRRIIALIRERGWTQQQAAEAFGVPQGRISHVVHGRISQFTIDYLINMLAQVGEDVSEAFETA